MKRCCPPNHGPLVLSTDIAQAVQRGYCHIVLDTGMSLMMDVSEEVSDHLEGVKWWTMVVLSFSIKSR